MNESLLERIVGALAFVAFIAFLLLVLPNL
jgi:hypothetical protein